jgi:hypothetical protein
MVKTDRRSLVALATGVSFFLAQVPAFAQAPDAAKPAAGQATGNAAAEPTKEAQEEARTRYQRGTQLYSDGAYELALIEFQRAYELAPSYKILYNVAQVNAQLGNYAGALKAFQRYLAEGGNDDKRKPEIEREIQNLQARTATLDVKVNVDGAEILIDGVPIGTTPFKEPLLVNAGQRKLTARKAGRQQIDKMLALAGGDSVTLEFALVEVAPPAPAPIAPVREKETIIERQVAAPTSYVWIGWVATGLFAAGAIGTGVGALVSAGDLKTARTTPLTSTQTPDDKRAELDDVQSRARMLGIATDVLGGAAILTGAVSLYFTLRKPDQKPAPAVGSVHLGVAPNGASVFGSF